MAGTQSVSGIVAGSTVPGHCDADDEREIRQRHTDLQIPLLQVLLRLQLNHNPILVHLVYNHLYESHYRRLLLHLGNNIGAPIGGSSEHSSSTWREAEVGRCPRSSLHCCRAPLLLLTFLGDVTGTRVEPYNLACRAASSVPQHHQQLLRLRPHCQQLQRVLKTEDFFSSSLSQTISPTKTNIPSAAEINSTTNTPWTARALYNTPCNFYNPGSER